MKKLSLLFVCILTIASCEKDTLTEDSFAADKTIENSKDLTKKGNKIAVCHKNKNIKFVNENALAAHIAHGDAVDLDGDGYFDQENSCSEGVDCDDTNADVNPGAEEICSDVIDNNCDGFTGYITTTVEDAPCTECTDGTSGNYRNNKNGKCRTFAPGDNIGRNWEPCTATVEECVLSN